MLANGSVALKSCENPVDFGVWDNQLVWTYSTSHLSEELGDQAVLLIGAVNVQRFKKQFLLNFDQASYLSQITKDSI